MRSLFTTNENAGVVAILVGLIVVVLLSVALSLLNSDEISLPGFSSTTQHVANDKLQSKINHLEIKFEEQKRGSKKTIKHREQSELLSEMERQIASANEEIGILKKLVASQRDAIKLIAKGKENYRAQYRDHIRAEALGKTYDSITTRLGKTYKDVRITDVSPIGVSFSHRHGAIRLNYPEMPRDWQTGLMYSAAECAKARLAEAKRQAVARNVVAKRVQKIRRVQETESSTRKITDLRRKIAVVSMRLASARTEVSLAQNKVSYQRSLHQRRSFASSSYRHYKTSTGTYRSAYYRPQYRITLNGAKHSVPGSLETWGQRAVRYERASARYAAQLANLRSSLIALDPSYRSQLEGGRTQR